MEKYQELLQDLREPSNLRRIISMTWDRKNGSLSNEFIFDGFNQKDSPQLVFRGSYNTDKVCFDNRLLKYIQDYKISQ